VTVHATDSLLISGQTSTGLVSGLFSETLGAGKAGQVTVVTPQLTLADGGQLSAETGGDGRGGEVMVQAANVSLASGAQIKSGSGFLAGDTLLVGAGHGGTITVTATDTIAITGQGSGFSATTAGAGRGGNITLQASRVQLSDGAVISAESTGAGDAGNVAITTQDNFLSTHGSVVTRATQADGGNIQITTRNLVQLRDSAITAEVGGGAQTIGGNITIDPQFIVLQNSQIRANAFEGQGGNIRLQAQQAFLADPASIVSASASSKLGIDGLVDIRSPVKSISGAVAPLPQSFARTTELLRNRCAERIREGTVSRFVLGGRDGVPLEPGSWLPSALEPLDQQPSGQGAQTPQARRRDSGGIVHIDNAGQEQVQGQYAQVRWPDGLDVECTRWLGQQRTRQ
jgi:large exoprotein involved in heme utilization and adhesion